MTQAPRIRILIVDDERLARTKIRRFVEEWDTMQVVAECSNGYEAVESLCEYLPEVVFLDIQMPELNGFEVLRLLQSSRLMPDSMPYIVFVTAYDQFALQAFAEHALDYVLKPFDHQRFQSTLAHVQQTVVQARAAQQQGSIATLLQQISPRYVERFAFKTRNKVYFVHTSQVEWIEADDNYALFHTGAEKHVLRETLSALEDRLNPEKFVRIHRSSIVNITFIKEILLQPDGSYIVCLHNNTRLSVGTTYREAVRRLAASGTKA